MYLRLIICISLCGLPINQTINHLSYLIIIINHTLTIIIISIYTSKNKSINVGFKIIPFESILTPSLKGLEDETSLVQHVYCDTVASLFMEQIHLHLEKVEQNKVSSARGSGGDNDTDQVRYVMMMTMMMLL